MTTSLLSVCDEAGIDNQSTVCLCIGGRTEISRDGRGVLVGPFFTKKKKRHAAPFGPAWPHIKWTVNLLVPDVAIC